ncbi:hypothetical protein FRB91_008382, partial [Serendipita sp. 411]
MSRLNAGAYEFVPGQSFRPPQQGQGAPIPPMGQQQPPQGGNNYHPNMQGGYQQVTNAYGTPQGYGQGYYPPSGPGYQNQYGNAYPYYQQYQQQQQQQPPRNHPQQQMPYYGNSHQQNPQLPSVPVPAPAEHEREPPPPQVADPPAPVVVSLNIGSSKTTVAAAPKDTKIEEKSAPPSAPASGT